MKIYKPLIEDHKYKLSAAQEIREALRGLGFKNVNPYIDQGCHWGTVYFFDVDLERAQYLMDPNDRMFRIETPTRFFYVSPYAGGPNIPEKWCFSVESNKPNEYKQVIRKKRGPYHK